MTQLKKEIEIVAASDLNVLISGETGTGKELVAKAIHEASPRAVNPLVYLNRCCTAGKCGGKRVVRACERSVYWRLSVIAAGSLKWRITARCFWMQIGELSLALQAKLLRVLQYGDIQRVGDDRCLRVDVRVLAATNRDLREEVLAGRFRADLFHRLSVFPLSAPPLRESGAMMSFCWRGISASSVACGRGSPAWSLRLSRSAKFTATLQFWPGNVRELEHAISSGGSSGESHPGSGDEVILEAQHFAFPEVTPMLPTARSRRRCPLR
ncbi:sigma 54-interacting transcriptional regulator [Klebsiella pneumoniae]|nr:sigma 54-interacting transcriptional regulator [Klebsiella pneumoniae]